MNKNERMAKLNNAGINTSKYFTLNLDNGTKIHVVVDENGNLTQLKNDNIAEQIITNGYVRNTKLHRRFVMAQMFHMLNYKSNDVYGYEEGYHAYLNKMYSYQYTLDMMLEEVKVLSCIEISDKESFDERSHFFTKEVVIDVVYDYVEKLREYVDRLPDHKCKGVPYKKIKGVNIFVADLNKRLYYPLLNKIKYMEYAKSYTALHGHFKDFMKDIIKLPYSTPKSKAWIDAFKGEGAYYTLKNLFMYHNCFMYVGLGDMLYRTEAMKELTDRLDRYQGEGWRMFALMKKVISDNDFNFNKRMVELGVK